MIIHRIKAVPDGGHCFAMTDGRKAFELRKEERDFCRGDYLVLFFQRPTRSPLVRWIENVYYPEGIKQGYCLLEMQIPSNQTQASVIGGEYYRDLLNHERIQAAVDHVVSMRKK